MKYTIRVRHKSDKPSRWASAGFDMLPGTTEGLKTAKELIIMMAGHPGNPGGSWEYRVFEYHGKRDYRPLEPK